MIDITELKSLVNIRDVWSALGGGKLRGKRGQAFWRNGNGYSVALNPERGLWHDFVSGEGGDILRLVETVRQCSFREALECLAAFAGMDLSESSRRNDNRSDTDWKGDLERATYWAIAAEMHVEDELAELPPWDLQRRELTSLLSVIKAGGGVLVNEYRRWRCVQPELTAALIHVGRLHDASVQRRLALWLMGYWCDDASQH